MLPRPTAKPMQERRKSILPVHVPRSPFSPSWDKLELELMLESEPVTVVGKLTTAPFSACNSHNKTAPLAYLRVGYTLHTDRC